MLLILSPATLDTAGLENNHGTVAEWNHANGTKIRIRNLFGCPRWKGDYTANHDGGELSICTIGRWLSNAETRQVLADKSPYGPGQVLKIDFQNLKIVFVEHRGFAPDGSTIYYIATDSSNLDVGKALGVLFVNKTGGTTLSGASSDLCLH